MELQNTLIHAENGTWLHLKTNARPKGPNRDAVRNPQALTLLGAGVLS